MALKIRKLNDSRYEAEASPPHMREQWKTPKPYGLRELIKELEDKGCHQIDIGDALYEIDPNWPSHLD